MSSEKSKNNLACYLMLAPMIIGFLVFTIYPLVWNAQNAFFEFDGVNKVFIGIDNFKRIFTRDAAYWQSILNAIIISYGKLIIEIPLALLLAVLLSKNIKLSGFFRSVYFMPTVIGVSISAVTFSKLFATSGGLINELLMLMNVTDEPVNWFGEKWSSMMAIMTMSIWANFGTNVLFFMSGVQGISADYYEAASIDGASSPRQFFSITLPLLKPIIRTILLLSMTSGIKLMDDVMLLTNGGPAGDTNVVMLYMYRYFFPTDTTPQLGYAAALGLVTSVILCILAVVYLRLTKQSDKVI